MVVMLLERVKQSLRGELTRWMLELRPECSWGVSPQQFEKRCGKGLFRSERRSRDPDLPSEHRAGIHHTNLGADKAAKSRATRDFTWSAG